MPRRQNFNRAACTRNGWSTTAGWGFIFKQQKSLLFKSLRLVIVHKQLFKNKTKVDIQ